MKSSSPYAIDRYCKEESSKRGGKLSKMKAMLFI